VRRLTIELPDYPENAPPVRLVVFSDIHVHGPDMPPSRVLSIVKQVNALHPDIIAIAGDFIGNNWIGRDYALRDATAPLSGLRAKLATVAVLGNNDHVAGADAVTQALGSAGVRVLDNEAVSIGPVALGGLDDRRGKTARQVGHNEEQTFATLRRSRGAKILIAHGPDEFPIVPNDIHLMLVGHTHCGQVVLPFFGPLITGSDFGQRYVCGVYHDGARTLIVSAGVGTSHVPLRYGAPPDLWVIEIKGRNQEISRTGSAPSGSEANVGFSALSM
jgi:hypothetical protein